MGRSAMIEPAVAEGEQLLPAVKEPAAAGEGSSAVKQPAEAAGKKPAEDPTGTEERGEEATTLPTRVSPIAEVAVALSTPDLPQDRTEPITNRNASTTVSRPRGRPAPRGEEAAALPCLKSPIGEAIVILPRLETSIAEATVVLPRRNSPQNDRRGEITQGSNRPPLPARRSVTKEAVIPTADRKRKQSTRASEKARTMPWEKRNRVQS
ncbi:hypothetical protein B296_00022633 [Ensete ventricosum]|uniref:Uncharacterized protein n=1 Tax=Ensete ventricosum TaxID=4639 RepID=A0A426XEE7_ENSVE|nr:hypothetical protein B296_00022633 [Ensete ventricosum]